MSVRTIEQKIAAGSQFDGQAPTTQRVYANDMESFPEDVQGGLFDLGNPNPVRILQVAIKLGGQSSWSLSIVDTDSQEIPVLTGTTETSIIDPTCNPILLQGQKLKLVTVGATGAMRCRITTTTKV